MIRIGQDFSKFPGGRYYADGPFSGEKFRNEVLLPALKSNKTITIDIDGTMGLPSSFLEEAFGGLVRQGYQKDYLLSVIEIRATEPRLTRYPKQIRQIIEDAE